MKTKTSRFVCLFLTLVLILTLGVACNKEQAPEEKESDTEAPAIETESPYDENGYLLDSLPDDMDFEKEQIDILCWNTSQVDEFEYAEMPKDAINQAFYKRNEAVAERTNTVLNFIQIDGDNANQGAFVQTATNGITGDSGLYDIIACYSMCAGTLMTKGVLRDLNTVDYLDMEKPWWSSTLAESATIKDKIYFISGDISGEIFYNMMFMIYNNDLGDNFGRDDPRLMVKDNTWTMAEMYKFIANTYVDDGLNGKEQNDTFGLMVPTQVLIDAFFYGCGYTFTENTEDGKVVLTDEFTGVATYDLLNKLTEVLHDTNDAIFIKGNQPFKAGRGMLGVAQAAMFRDIREEGWNYSILPMPKLDEKQELYYSALGFGYSYYTIPVNTSTADCAGAVIEALASDSYRNTTPEIFEVTFKSRFSNDELDYEMFDIIRAGLVTDSARIFSSQFKWSESCLGLLRNCVMNDTAGSWVSDLSNYKDSIQNKFTDIFKGFEA